MNAILFIVFTRIDDEASEMASADGHNNTLDIAEDSDSMSIVTADWRFKTKSKRGRNQNR